MRKMFSLALAALTLVPFTLAPLVLSGCGREAVVTDPSTLPPATQTEEFSEEEARARQMETWIARMDPYVSQSGDLYAIDWDQFLLSIQGDAPDVYQSLVGSSDQLTGDAQIVQELHLSIPLANAQMQLDAGQNPETPLGYSRHYYWWGIRDCYWGATAWQIAGVIGAGGGLPWPWGAILTPYAAWAGYLTGVHGGFCANQSWFGGPPWLTAHRA